MPEWVPRDSSGRSRLGDPAARAEPARHVQNAVPKLRQAFTLQRLAEISAADDQVVDDARALPRGYAPSGPGGPLDKDTCRDYVLSRLKAAGWNDEQIQIEFPITDGRIISVGSKHRRGDALRADYVLEYRPGLPIAVVEAKRDHAIPGKGLQQGKNYAQLLDVPFTYATNGTGIVEDDRSTGRETDNLHGFPGPEDLWARFRAFEGLDDELSSAGVALPFNRSLRNFDGSEKEPRYYQRTTINRSVAAVLRGDKRVLLTLATGTGTTFVSMQIVSKLWNSGWRSGRRPRMLYLADRKILIDERSLEQVIPLPPIDVQYQLASSICALKALESARRASAGHLAAILPSLLNREFAALT